MEKKFIRFVCNTKDHERGKKIKALNIITKVFDDEDKFIEVKKPYIKALANQIEIDIDIMFEGKQIDYHKYLPLHHFKHDKGSIVKKSDTEIQTLEAEMAQTKQQKEIEKNQKEQDLIDAKNIMVDETKTDKERLEATINIINNKL